MKALRFALPVLFSLPMIASAEYTARLDRSSSVNSFSLIVGRIHLSAVLILEKDGREFVRLPVQGQGRTAGLQIGAGSNDAFGNSELRLRGLNDDTKLGDLLGLYQGSSSGGSWLLPYPGLNGGGRALNLNKVAREGAAPIAMEIALREGFGLEIGAAKMQMNLDFRDTRELGNREWLGLTLRELVQRREGYALERGTSAVVSCQFADGAMQLTMNSRIERRSLYDVPDLRGASLRFYPSGLWSKSLVVKESPRLEGSTLSVEGVDSNGHVLRLELDLGSETAAANTDRLSAFKLAGTVQARAFVTLKDQSLEKTATCKVGSDDGLHNAALAAQIFAGYLR